MSLIKLSDNEREVLAAWQDGEWWNTSDREIYDTKLHLKCRGLLQPRFTTAQLQDREINKLSTAQEYKITRRGRKALGQSNFVAWDAGIAS